MQKSNTCVTSEGVTFNDPQPIVGKELCLHELLKQRAHLGDSEVTLAFKDAELD